MLTAYFRQRRRIGETTYSQHAGYYVSNEKDGFIEESMELLNAICNGVLFRPVLPSCINGRTK